MGGKEKLTCDSLFRKCQLSGKFGHFERSKCTDQASQYSGTNFLQVSRGVADSHTFVDVSNDLGAKSDVNNLERI